MKGRIVVKSVVDKCYNSVLTGTHDYTVGKPRERQSDPSQGERYGTCWTLWMQIHEPAWWLHVLGGFMMGMFMFMSQTNIHKNW